MDGNEKLNVSFGNGFAPQVKKKCFDFCGLPLQNVMISKHSKWEKFDFWLPPVAHEHLSSLISDKNGSSHNYVWVLFMRVF